MQTAKTNLYIVLLLVGLCIVQALAAPTDTDTDDSVENNSSAGDSSVSTTTVSSDLKPQDTGKSGPPQISPIKSASPVTTHVRVKRNKNPIRYHAKSVRRQ